MGRDDAGHNQLAVCEPEQSAVDLGANKPPQAYVTDIEEDGLDEVLVGVSTGASPFVGTVVAVSDGQVVDRQIPLEVTVGGSGQDGTSFGCVDTDGDGRRELVNLRYRFSAGSLDGSEQVTWWRWPAGTDPEAESESGTLDVTTDRHAIETLIDGTCGDAILVDVAT